jgi:cytosine permease
VWNELEPMTYMFLVGFGGLALAVLVFATWTTNAINLYSTALSARASIPIGSYRIVVVIIGIVGTGAALIGIAENLINFFIVLGLLVPPIAGVYLTDFFIFRRTDFSAERLDNRPPIVVNAAIAGIGSGFLAIWMYFSEMSLTTIAPLDSLVISVVVYLLLEFARLKFGNR